MARISAGLLLYRRRGGALEVLLVHPGGPFWRKKDDGAWSIPKGECAEGEDPRLAARREFREELGTEAPAELALLGDIRQRSGKRVTAFAAAGDFNPDTLRSNEVEIAWPPRSGRTLLIPEVDRAGWFTLPVARLKILAAQIPFLDRLQELDGGRAAPR
jgi:predicted NUDIX family NTP pyrophosphohydrolase